MNTPRYRLLLQLKELIIRERMAARMVDMQELATVQGEQAELLARLKTTAQQAPDAETRTLLAEVQRELRRNVRLYHGAMQAILGLWSIHCRRDIPPAYDQSGGRPGGSDASRMLCGKI